MGKREMGTRRRGEGEKGRVGDGGITVSQVFNRSLFL